MSVLDKILSIRNPSFRSSGIDLEIHHEDFGWIPFHATATDPEAHGRELYQRALAGEFGTVAPYVEPPKTKDQLLQAIRDQKVAMRDGGMDVHGLKFDTDTNARIAYNELVMKFMVDPTYVVQDWKASEGVWVQMDFGLYQEVMATGEALLQQVFAWQREQEAIINAMA